MTNKDTQVRYIYSRFGVRQVGDLLQTIVAAELIKPSRQLWIVSPWISDIPVLDNRANTFSSIAPEWSRGLVTLSAVIRRLITCGSVVHIATRSEERHNLDFIGRMRHLGSDDPRIKLHLAPELHDKGILGDGFYLAGSMNLTYAGISINDEALHFTTDPAVVAEQQIAFRSRWAA